MNKNKSTNFTTVIMKFLPFFLTIIGVTLGFPSMNSRLIVSQLTELLIDPPSWSYELCENSNDNTFVLDHLSMTPDPPRSSQNLTVIVRGDLAKRVAEGSVLELEVKYLRIRLVKQTMDICTELTKVKNAPEYCPIEAGKKDWSYTVEMPRQIPPGKYNIRLNLLDQDQQQVWCSAIELEM